jgi:hypothetical protein
MNTEGNWPSDTLFVFLVLGATLGTIACSHSELPKGAIGNIGRYNYSPSVIEANGMRYIWWCSLGTNPADNSQTSDAIFYESVNMTTLETQGPLLVLAETPGAWDGWFTCNPKVVGGVFQNPLGDGKTYRYAMYYVATRLGLGVPNSIGVAFSNDGIHWRKYPEPVIRYPSEDRGYGVGQPSLYYDDRKSVLWLFYEQDYPIVQHMAAVSNDGLHFTVRGTVTTNGLNPDNPNPGWGDLAYEPKEREWYATFNCPGRSPSTTGGVTERGNYGVELYKISESSLLTGGFWQHLSTIDTNASGFEANFIAGFVRDQYGNMDLASSGKVEMYTSVSYPAPLWWASPAQAGRSADVSHWILMPMDWVPTVDGKVAFNRYFNGATYEVTTGWISPSGGFQLQSTLGYLYTTASHGATVPLYGCKAEETDYFVSLDPGCEGHRILGLQGYAYQSPISGQNLLGLYRCITGRDHFVSKDPKCEGQTTDRLLAYVLP